MTTKPNSGTVSMSRELRSVLAMVLNALDRDAEDGKAVRGEMASELRAILAQPADQQGEPIWLYVDCDGYTGWTDRWDTAKHLPYLLQKVYRHAQPATAKVDERVEFEEWYAGYEKRRAQNGWMPLERSQVTRMFEAWQARAKLNGGQS